MLQYLLQRESEYQMAAEEEADWGGPYPDGAGLGGAYSPSSVADFFLQVADGAYDVEESLLNTLRDPEKLAATLSHIGKREKTHPKDTREARESTEAMRQTLRYISNAVAGYPNEVRAKYLDNIAKAITALNADAPDDIASELLAPGVGHGEVEDEVLSCLGETTMVNVITSHVVFHEGTSNTLSNFLDEFLGDPERGERIKRAIAANLSRISDERVQSIAKILDGELAVSAELGHPGGQGRNRIYEQREVFAQVLTISPDEMVDLAKLVETETVQNGDLHAAELALCLFADAPPDTLTPTIVDMVAAGISVAWERGDYTGVTQMLDKCVHMSAHDQGIVDHILESVVAPAHVDQLVEALRAAERNKAASSQILALLKRLGDYGVKTLFERLVVEKNRTMRLFIVGLLGEFGDAIIPYLTSQIGHRPWFVLRNVALLLGKTRSASALNALEQIVAHSDKRVRTEVLEAVAMIKTPRSEEIIVRSLADPDPAVAESAAEWLGKMGAGGAVSVLTSMLDVNRLRHKPDLALGILKTVALLGGQAEIDAIESFKPSWWLRLSKDGRKLNAVCTECIQQIQQRLKAAETDLEKQGAGAAHG